MIRRRLLEMVRGLRFRLIGWYVLLLLVSLIFFSVYSFVQFRDLQQSQQDTLLDASADKLRGMIDTDIPTSPYIRNYPGPGANPDGSGGVLQDISRQNVQVRIFSIEGRDVGTIGNTVGEMPTLDPASTGTKLVTVDTTSNGQWRIYNSPLFGRNGPGGWIQVGQPVVQLNAEFNRLFVPILVGTLIALMLAIMGGLFLANQALKPIDRVARTAQSITTQDLTRRINYKGPRDEIGRLAQTIDRMLDRLEHGFEQERRFTSDASHELRTPLTALKGRLEVTLNRERTTDEYRQTLADLNLGVDRLIGLTNSLLYLARLDQGNQQWQSEDLKLDDLLDSIVESLQPMAELKEIELTCQLAADVEVEGNLDQLTRLFLNLLGNALKYTPNQGQVKVRLEKNIKDKKAIVSVSDNGPGIAPEHLPHLFERFYRAESDRATATGGTGLGLAIAHEITRQHDGSLEIESQVGKGTTARLLLPLADQK